jgi:alkanesulfonate monooxygenase SsuD/methylene tetrahydromethanopterin reductase-like flavin-dependent oxidoreductase (luciferase family)
MKYGITIPNFGAYADLNLLRDLARDAETAGWDGFFLWDHINWSPFGLAAGAGGRAAPTLDPWIALAAIATVTERIKIGTMVTPLARRRPWIVARQAVTLDHLSDGRLILGVGLGFPAETEFGAFGEEAANRVRAEKLDESLAIIDGLWSGTPFSFAGKHYNIAETTFLPRPVQRPRIPVWVAGMWPARAPMRRAARYDGAFPIKSDLGFLDLDEVRAIAADVRAHRMPGADGEFDLTIGSPMPQDPTAARAYVAPFDDAGVTWWMSSDPEPEQLRARLRTGPPPRR